ncbi:MAG: hypothetical protein IJ401_04095, partial [Oscillospiraceae bacterium]|nr:hypothetical protein [Oscillospiraceae bacterium]
IALVIVFVAINFIIPNVKYRMAVSLMDEGKYTEAISAFKAMGGYKDSVNKIEECNTAILDGKYNDAKALMDEGKYTDAISAFEAMGGYKDSINKIEECNINIYGEETWNSIKNVSVGDTYIFGSYEQDNNNTNGQEDIEWVVLSKEGSRIFVISKYILDEKPYNTSREDITWETCTLRKWLNNDFINSAFSDDERARIPKVTVSADNNLDYDTNPGKATQDHVFLLSIIEANKYFTSDSARQCDITKYASKHKYDYSGWWLRSPGYRQFAAADVNADGDIVGVGFIVDNYVGVRPAMWVEVG